MPGTRERRIARSGSTGSTAMRARALPGGRQPAAPGTNLKGSGLVSRQGLENAGMNRLDPAQLVPAAGKQVVDEGPEAGRRTRPVPAAWPCSNSRRSAAGTPARSAVRISDGCRSRSACAKAAALGGAVATDSRYVTGLLLGQIPPQ